ncbi:NAD-dependent epimerase/dehydratase family protein [Salirhabdus salicampi]|uniref:NAD-dependent epimerase/dehydratase family protein n=1 Tax=Salirhabdus salicampi TaxID=476102 RepID=UPI0020C2A05F|nr:NAD(P)-dependent oxidoreductase [Salirhabdus salicampi]MCP8615825.1 NAD(P)-dependent oxidoreductase [Salirhabdus salicampi]
MKVLLFGSSGYIGSKIVKLLKKDGVSVVGADITKAVTTDEIVDIRFPEDTFSLVGKVKPDVIINMAYILAGGAAADPHKVMRLNITGVNGIFEAAVHHNIPRVIHSSSIAVYGDQKDFGSEEVTEDTHGKPATLYGWMKQYNEACARHYDAHSDTRFIGVRISSLYGGGRVGGKFNPIGTLTTAPQDHSPITIPTPSHHEACFIHVDDVAKVFYLLTTSENPKYDMYNTGGDTFTVKKLAELASKVMNRTISCDEHGEDFPHVSRVNNDRFESEFPFKRINITDYIKETFSENRNEVI